MSFVVVIPARYASTRLPGKLLLEISNKPVLQYVWQQAMASGADRVIIATDDKKIFDVANKFGAEVCMTSVKCKSGTERLAEVVKSKNLKSETIVVNLQGDEPLMLVAYIKQVVLALEDSDAAVATLACEIKSQTDILSADVVKVILNKNSEAIYFSRSPIPATKTLDYLNLDDFRLYLRHIGIYAYRAKFLQKYVDLSESEIEKSESLEQLRVLYHDYKIKVELVDEMPGPGIDSQADFDKVSRIILEK